MKGSNYSSSTISGLTEFSPFWSNQRKTVKSLEYWLFIRQVVVYVTDANDNSPEFQFPSPYKMAVPEDAPLGTGVGRLVARDEDAGVNGQFEFAVTHANIGEHCRATAKESASWCSCRETLVTCSLAHLLRCQLYVENPLTRALTGPIAIGHAIAGAPPSRPFLSRFFIFFLSVISW